MSYNQKKLRNIPTSAYLFIPNIKTTAFDDGRPIPKNKFPEETPVDLWNSPSLYWKKFLNSKRQYVTIYKNYDYMNEEILVEAFKGNCIKLHPKNIK